MHLNMLYDLILGVGAYHETAIASDLFRQKSSGMVRPMFLIKQPEAAGIIPDS